MIIGLVGPKRSGKDTVFEFIKKEFSSDANQIVLAQKIKDVCSEISELGMEYFTDQALKEQEVEPLLLDNGALDLIFNAYDITDYDEITEYRPHLNKMLYTPREMMQYIGTEVLRNIDDDIHCRAADRLVDPSKINVITDIRFFNELSFFKDKYGFKFRPLYIQRIAAEVVAVNSHHASEREPLKLKDYCEVIENNGTLEELKFKVVTGIVSLLTS